MVNVVRPLLLAVGFIGALLFGAAFVTSILNPGYVEEIAKDIIRTQVEKKTREKLHAIDSRFLAGKAGAFIKQESEKIEHAKQQLIARLPEKVAAVIAEMRNLDCECRKKIEKSMRDGFELKILVATAAQEHLTTLIRTKYMETAEKLTREFRIFTGTNTLVFALLAFAAYFKRGAGMLLIAPTIVLVVAASITGYLYLLNQNWLHTIVFNSYVGMAYVGYMAIVFALLCDVLFNRARITARLLNIMFQFIGSAAHVVPC